jgi:hypothetical protein
MKPTVYLSLLILFLFTAIISCERSGDDSIVYQSVNKEFVLIRDVQALRESNDEISDHVDSILTGLINTEFVSTGRKDFDLNADIISDIGFEIIDLNKFNPDGLPESFDSLAARVNPLTVEILDNSTWGYPDALEEGDRISDNGYWSDRTSVLGTFLNGGKFQGMGERYLGMRFTDGRNNKYGWIRIYCSQHNDTLRIIDFAYNNIEFSDINAGQTE